jgi:hypothetical protein
LLGEKGKDLYLFKMNCPVCKSKDSLYVYNDLNNVVAGWKGAVKLYPEYKRRVEYDGNLIVSDMPI